MIVVFGSTGRVGPHVVHELAARGAPVRCVSRSPSRAAMVLPQGTPVVRADLTDPESVRAAVRGASAVLVLSPHSPRQHVLQSRLLDFAADAGAERIVKLSGLDAAVTRDSTCEVGRLHWQTEQRLRVAGPAWTVVRPTPFMQNTLEWLGHAVRLGRLLLPMGHAPAALVDAADVGAVLATTLMDNGHDGRTYVVTGPEALPFEQVADALGDATGRDLRYRPVPGWFAATAQRLQGVEPWLVDHHGAIAALVSGGAAATVTDTVREVTGREPRDFRQFAAVHRAPR